MKLFQSLLIFNGIVAGFTTTKLKGQIIFEFIEAMVPIFYEIFDFRHIIWLLCHMIWPCLMDHIIWYSSAIATMLIYMSIIDRISIKMIPSLKTKWNFNTINLYSLDQILKK